MARRRVRHRFEEIEIDLALTQDDLISDLDPGWGRWRKPSNPVERHD